MAKMSAHLTEAGLRITANSSVDSVALLPVPMDSMECVTTKARCTKQVKNGLMVVTTNVCVEMETRETTNVTTDVHCTTTFHPCVP